MAGRAVAAAVSWRRVAQDGVRNNHMGTIENGYTLCEMERPVRLGNLPGKLPRGRRTRKQASRAGYTGGHTLHKQRYRCLARLPRPVVRAAGCLCLCACASVPRGTAPSALSLTSHGTWHSTAAARVSPGPRTEGGPGRPAGQPASRDRRATWWGTEAGSAFSQTCGGATCTTEPTGVAAGLFRRHVWPRPTVAWMI